MKKRETARNGPALGEGPKKMVASCFDTYSELLAASKSCALNIDAVTTLRNL